MPPKKAIKIWKNRCINPFQKVRHKATNLKLRGVSQDLRLKFPTLPEGAQICSSCRYQLINSAGISPLNSGDIAEPSDRDKVDTEDHEMISEDDEYQLYDSEKDLDVLDTQLQCENEYHKAGVEVLDQIIEKFNASKDLQEQFQLLSLAPKSWGRRKLMQVFNTSERKARNIKKLVSEHGILTLPNPKRGRALTPETETLVKNFYERDDLSRMMPGMKDFVSIKNDDGTRSHVQKRLLLCNLNELYAQFTSEHVGLKISISKFTKLRPRHCVLAGSSGTHNAGLVNSP